MLQNVKRIYLVVYTKHYIQTWKLCIPPTFSTLPCSNLFVTNVALLIYYWSHFIIIIINIIIILFYDSRYYIYMCKCPWESRGQQKMKWTCIELEINIVNSNKRINKHHSTIIVYWSLVIGEWFFAFILFLSFRHLKAIVPISLYWID